MSAKSSSHKFIDIAVNLTDPMYAGIYRGKQLHPSDLDHVVARARQRGVERMIITGTDLDSNQSALDLARKYDLHCTIGCHPTSTQSMEQYPGGPKAYVQRLSNQIKTALSDTSQSRRVVAIGEIGLDYDRLQYSPVSTQLACFALQLALGQKWGLPFFLHSRHSDAHRDLIETLRAAGWRKQEEIKDPAYRAARAVVHSFTGSIGEMQELLQYGIYVGINGCSLKTKENIDVVKALPLDRMMLETDAPWCSITSTSVSHGLLPPKGSLLAAVEKAKVPKPESHIGSKGRNEPADISTIAYVVAKIKEIPVDQVVQAAWENTVKVFYP